MYRLKPSLKIQVPPPEAGGQKTGLILISNPANGQSLQINQRQVVFLRALAQFPLPEAASKLNIGQAQLQEFVDKLLVGDFLDKVSSLPEQASIQPSLQVVSALATSNQPAIGLRDDLELSQDQDTLMIFDTKANRAFSFGLNETKMLNQLLTKPLVNVAHENDIAVSSLEEFVQQLGQKGLLGQFYGQLKQPVFQASADKTLFSFLVQRFKLGNPDNFLAGFCNSFAWLWSVPLMAVHAAFFVFALFIWVEQHSLFSAAGFPQIASNFVVNGLIFLLIVSLVLTTHEFAHGLALKHFGGKVPEMGLFLMYGFPAAYTNVTDAYRLKTKLQKAWVILAGVIFQVWMGCLGLIIWSLAYKGNLVANLAYMLAYAAFLNLLFNLNPFIKLDGYYLLTLMLGKPNLREKSWNFVKTGFKTANGFGEAMLFLVYGLCSIAYTVGLLAFLVLSVFKFGLQTAPFITVFVILLLFLIGKTPLPVKEVVKLPSSNMSSASSSRVLQASGVGQELVQSKEESKQVSYQQQSFALPLQNTVPENKKSFNFWPFALMALIVGVLFVQVSYQIGGEVAVNPAEGKRALIRSSIQGVVKSLKVKSGDYVEKGQILLELTDWNTLDQITQMSGGNAFSGGSAPRLDALNGAIEESKIQNSKLSIELKKAELNYQNEMKKANTFTKLASEGAYPKTLAEQAVLNAELAREEINKLRQEVKYNAQNTDIARANYSSLSGQLNFYKQKSGLQIIKSPIAGYVLTEDNDFKLGTATSPDQTLMTIADLSEVQVRVKVGEENLAFVKVGQPITLTLRAFPGEKFKGKVSVIALMNEDPNLKDPTAQRNPLNKYWNVTMMVDNKDQKIKPGMSGYAFIDSKRKLAVKDILLREIYRVFPLEKFAVFQESFPRLKP